MVEILRYAVFSCVMGLVVVHVNVSANTNFVIDTVAGFCQLRSVDSCDIFITCGLFGL